METMAHSHVPPELPGYEIERRIGSGGNATVWLARQLSLDRVVAIKILAPKLLRDPEAREQFQQEARAAARISHAAIVGILDFGEHDGLLYYVMEYVAGTNLAEWLHVNQRMAHTQALKLVEIVATALNQVWRDAGLIHCDIKPGNILLGEDGAVKITDLGLARIAGAAATREPSACIEGTPTYIAPEQIEGYLPDIRTDIYSLGLTFYHMLTGTPPFEGYSLDEVIEAQQTDYLPDPCEVLPHLPVSYGWLLAKMTAKNPAKRPANWDEVLKDIQQIKSGKSPLPPYPAEDESTILLSPRHRPAARANTINLSAAAKKAITLTASPDMLISQQKRGSVAQSISSGGGGCLRFFFFLLFLAALGGAGWFFGLRGHPERVEQIKAAFTGKPKRPPSSGIPDIPIRSAPADADAAAQAVVEESSAPAAPDELEKPLVLSAGSPSATPGAWNHPGFIQAANLFNQALTNYQAHLKAPETAQVSLVGIISDAQYAAVLFETIRPDAPADVPVTLYANQCYQLVNDARRARLTQEDKQNLFTLAPKKRHEKLAPYPTPPADVHDMFAARYMQFGYAWDTLPAPVDRLETSEFVYLLNTVAEPSPDTRAHGNLSIHGPLKWLMPFASACKLIGADPRSPRVPVEGIPFPYGGFFMRTYKAGRFGRVGPGQPAYPNIRLITDSEDQLVAVQLVDERPPAPCQSSPMAFSPVARVMDFVSGKVVPEKGDIRVAHTTFRGEGTLRIDTEAADFVDGPEARPQFRSILLLPQAVANNLLYHLLGSRD